MTKSVFTEAYASLLETLKRTRKEAGVSQTELARRLNKPQQFISYLERGERRIDVIEFYAIMQALGADPEKAFADVVRRLPKRVEI